MTTTDEGFCWGGFGVLESLGIGSDLSLFQRCGRGLCRLTPAPVVPASAYAEIRPQPEVQLYTCALLRDASIACAGVTGFFSPVAPSGLTASFIPVVGLPPARQLVVGSTQPCIVSTSDEGWCAGSFSGNVSHAPARIRPDLKLRSLVIVQDAMCGIATDGLTYCWNAHEPFAGGGTPTDPAPNALVLVAGQVP